MSPLPLPVPGNNPSKSKEMMVQLMNAILSNKPFATTDIRNVDDAKQELGRIRVLVHYFANDAFTPLVRSSRRLAHNPTIREADYSRQYVKQTFPKSEPVRALICDAIKPNLLFEMYTQDELNKIVDIFQACSFKAGATVIEQGEKGNFFYVVESGELSVSLDPPQTMGGSQRSSKFNDFFEVGHLSKGAAFGELALMFGSPRATTVKALTECKLWRVKRDWYRGLIGQERQRVLAEKIDMLSNVVVGSRPFRKYFDKDQLSTIAQLMWVQYYREGDVIIREGEEGDTCYLIAQGKVVIYKKALGDQPIPYERKYFGEQALLSDSVRSATCVAASTLTCHVLSRSDFNRVMGRLGDIFSSVKQSRRSTQASVIAPKVKYQLKDLKILNVIGQGAFGKVKLAKSRDSSTYYALKIQRKDYIVAKKQQDFILHEYMLLMQVSHPNIVTMHCAMQCSKFLYFLMDLLPGGDLMTLLSEHKSLPEEWIKFYSASVLLAFNELHARNIAYRDLKPENLMLDTDGYCVMVDFGIAKSCDGPTYTLCGTADYLAPEIIQGTGYGVNVDYWALGVLMWELYQGQTPFYSCSQTSMMNKILKGRLEFPETMSSSLKDVIHSLLTRDPSRRIGCLQGGTEEVMKQRFFGGFDWYGWLGKTVPAPHKPQMPESIEKMGTRDAYNFRDRAQKTDWVADL